MLYLLLSEVFNSFIFLFVLLLLLCSGIFSDIFHVFQLFKFIYFAQEDCVVAWHGERKCSIIFYFNLQSFNKLVPGTTVYTGKFFFCFQVHSIWGLCLLFNSQTVAFLVFLIYLVSKISLPNNFIFSLRKRVWQKLRLYFLPPAKVKFQIYSLVIFFLSETGLLE